MTIKRDVKIDLCYYCESSITQSAKDGAWEDASGACGCGRGEHEPLGDRPVVFRDYAYGLPAKGLSTMV